ncbi:MAG: ParB/RepB/Spo0J family partition protein [Gammaproteobacteria bacterium]|jgi:ParB family chromosome partitioning protein
MATKKRGLGKGLDALLGGQSIDEITHAGSDDVLRSLPVDLLQRSPYQPRTDFSQQGLEELANSIRAQGVVQPVVVRPLADGGYQIIAGERRWRAAQMAGLHNIPAVVRGIDDRGAMCLALIENIQRQDLNPLEEARGISRLLEEFEMTHDAVAEAVGKSRSTITNLLRLLELSPAVKKMLEAGEIEMGHARALLPLAAEQQLTAARQVARQDLSVRATENLVRKLSQRKPAKKKSGAARIDPDIRRLQDELSEKLGSPVTIRHGRDGKGKLEIHYASLDELDGIITHLR